MRDQVARERHQAGLVGDGQERPTGRRDGLVGPCEVQRHVAAIAGDLDRAGEEQGNRARQEAVLHRPDSPMQGGEVIV